MTMLLLTRMTRLVILAAALASAHAAATAQTVRTVQDASLRSERAGDAAALATLASNAPVNLLQLSGGWAQVQTPGPTGVRGWLRASLLDLRPPEVAPASQIETGRRASGNTAVTLGSRSLPPRSNRHALIIGIGRYRIDAARRVEPLAGTDHDMTSALLIARTLQVPDANITLLRDEAATSDGIEAAIRELGERALPGDRVFVYWSGHGSRWFDAAEGGCVESLVPYDLADVTNRQLARWLQPIGAKADKMLVVYDACHSGGLAARSLGAGGWQPKFVAPRADTCQTASNVRTRSLGSAAAALGLSGQDVVTLSSSRPDEVSLQSAAGGSLATSALRQCLLGDAVDADGSGSVSAQELADCAQAKVDAALAGNAQFGPPHLTLAGNRDFVPAWFANAVVPAPQAPLARVLEQIHGQRDGKRTVSVVAASARLRIGGDGLRFSVTSSHAGQVYVAMLGSDGSTLYLLFPNALDTANRIGAGETLSLPRAGWSITAGGPPGTDKLLVLVADGARDLPALRGARDGPFVQPLTDAQGRAQLQWLLGTNARLPVAAACSGSACSDAFGAALVEIEEY
jgi:Caspase domain/Domain of unknown function (DUF4384)